MILGHLGGASNGKFGGAEKSMVKLANWMSKRCETILVSVDGSCDSFDILPSVQCDFYETNHNNKLVNNLCLKRNSLEAIKRHKPDIVIGFWIQSSFYVSFYCKSHNIKLFYTERNDPRLQYGKLLRSMRKILLSRCKGIIFQTHEAMSYFPTNVQKKAVVIHNPVYISKETFNRNTTQKDNKPDNRIVAIGRLSPQKNHKLLIEAFCQIAQEFPQTVLEIYGEGPLKNELKELINTLGLQSKVFLRGTFKDILQRISNASLFVLSSNYEGMPNTLLEAMSLSLPCISTDCPCGGPREIIEDGVNGLLIPTRDSVSLASAMRHILSSPDFASSLGKNAIKIRDTHNEDKIFQMWYDFIQGKVLNV